MQRHELELTVGDTVQIGDCLVTVIDISGDEISFRVDDANADVAQSASSQSTARPGK